MTRSFSLLFALLGFTSMAHAHMRLSSPVPFDAGNSDNGPLLKKKGGSDDGKSVADFPCKKSIFKYAVTAMNTIPVDEPVLLGFDGSAVHGGGSCQLSISLDEEPDEKSVFKVIQTYEGGCPTPNGGFTFNIPKEFPSAERATFAWTWISKLSGTQEFYMDCAPIKITGGSDNKDFFDTLPDMFKANIPEADGCESVLSTDVEIPAPGKFVLQTDGVTLTPPTGQCGAPKSNNKNAATESNLAAFTAPAKDSNQVSYVAGSSGSAGAAPTAPAAGGNSGAYDGGSGSSGAGNSGAGNSGAGNGAGGAQSYDDGSYKQPTPTSQVVSSPAATSSVAATSQPASSLADSPSSAPTSSAPPANQLTSSAQQTTFQTLKSSASSPEASSPSASAAQPYPYPTLSPSSGAGISPTAGAASPSGTSSSSSSSSNNTNNSTTCSENGAVVCNGSDQFGLCNNGKVVWQTVAAGTECRDGVVQKRDVGQAVKAKRHAHFGRHARGVRL